MVTVSVPDVTAGNPATYRVVVNHEASSIELRKRFSDFLKLAEDVREEVNEPVPVEPPRKKWFGGNGDPAFLEQRRVELETMLRALVRDSNFCATLAVASFLELGKLTAPASRAAAAGDWLSKSAHLRQIVTRARSAAEADKRRQLALEGRVLAGQLHKQLANEGRLGNGERARRAETIDDALRALSLLESSEDDTPSVAQATMPSRGGRVLGETDVTRPLNNAQLLVHQQQTMQNQDKTIEELRTAISRQKELGLAIDDELTRQNHMLDELDAAGHHLNNRLNQAKRKTGKFL